MRNPGYFVSGQPYIERIEAPVDEDSASRIASFLAGKYDLGYDGGYIFRTEWAQIKDAVKQKRPTLKTIDVVANIFSHLSMRTDQKPFNDVRVRQAISLAVDRQGLMDVGIEAKLDQKEYGAYFATCFQGKFDSMAFGPQTSFLEPDGYLYGQYMPGEPRNQSHITDPVVTDLIVRQRRTSDVVKRRELIHEIQRHLAKQQYYVQIHSGLSVAAWENALKNYAPNLGLDLGGRLTAAWLER